jgi:hypothetical protein
MKVIMREEFPKSGENALNPEVSVEAGTEPPKKKVDSNVSSGFSTFSLALPQALALAVENSCRNLHHCTLCIVRNCMCICVRFSVCVCPYMPVSV